MRQATLFLFLLSFRVSASADFDALFTGKTLRFDYYHSGNATTEMFSLDRVVREPLAWSGNMSQPIDRTLRGKYAFEIVDPASGDVAWSRSFSSIYGEWETTGEARERRRTFHESLRFPAPTQPVEVVIKKRDTNNDFVEGTHDAMAS